MNSDLRRRLEQFQSEQSFRDSTTLAVALFATRSALDWGVPSSVFDLLSIDSDHLGQLEQEDVDYILSEHRVAGTLLSEKVVDAGASGLQDSMQAYVAFLNAIDDDEAVLSEIEEWWIAQVKDYLRTQPFRLEFDPSWSFETVVQRLLDQVRHRQTDTPNTDLLDRVLKHLFGATLEIALGGDTLNLEHHSASVADSPTRRPGDFKIDDAVIHVTTVPSQALLEKCGENLSSGYRPIVVTLFDSVDFGRRNADVVGIRDRVDIVAAEQFIVGNLHEWSKFQNTARATTLAGLVDKYNQIIDYCETDPSLRIEFGG